ncbi:MAG TPA: hypothetical protein VGM06_02330 [Polyangiaceae bacterium]
MKRCIPLLAVALFACTNGQGEVDVTVSNQATFPGAPPGVAQLLANQTVTTDSFVTVDVKSDLDQIGKLGSLTAVISENVVTGADLSFLKHVTATMETEDSSMPLAVLADLDVPANATELELSPMQVSDATVLAYLSEGKVDIHFAITGQIPDRPITLTHSLVAHLNVAVQGSVLKSF